MCGLTGWFSRAPLDNQDYSLLEKMRDTILHRGPDGHEAWLDTHVALAHTRLAIIDLNQGQQPMHSLDGTTVISFNGEIYNYKELRYSLVQKDYQFKTHSDTEVIIALYQQYGIQGFNQLRGMYAFALWDKIKKTGYLVRDPMGIKPLFYFLDDNELIFASEAKAILCKRQECAELNPKNLHLLMNFRYLPNNLSLFRNVYQLKPGQIITWSCKYAALFDQIEPQVNNSSYSSTLAALTDSLQVHTTSDVEIGAYLSGGIDSASLCALSKQIYKNKIKTFTLGIGDDPNESINAQRTAELLGLENIHQAIDFDIQSQLVAMVWHLETPKINSLQIGLLAQLAAKHIKVVLSGLGADELFCGYRIHNYLYRCQKLKKVSPKFLNKLLAGSIAGLIRNISPSPYSEAERGFSILSNLGNWPKVYGLFRNVWDSPKLRRIIYGPRLLDASLDSAFDVIEDAWPSKPNPLAACLEFENSQKLVNDLLWQEDRMSMAHGLEVRVPFVDTHLKSALAGYSTEMLMPNGKLKYHLKQSVNSLLASEIINRPKSGFQIDAPKFFNDHLRPLANRYLSHEMLTKFGLFNPVFVRKVLKLKPHTRLRWHYFMLYLMMLSHIWIEQFEQTK